MLNHSSRDLANLAKETGFRLMWGGSGSDMIRAAFQKDHSSHGEAMAGGVERSLRWLLKVPSKMRGMSEPGRDCAEGTGVPSSGEGQGEKMFSGLDGGKGM